VAMIRKNKTLARSIVLAGTALAGVGIWAVVSSQPPLNANGGTQTSIAFSSPSNSSFSAGDAFLNQPTGYQSGANSSVGNSGSRNAVSNSPRIRTRGS
jgi:hypothetical protein